MAENYSILIAALVAVVAIVGLVLYSNTGAVVMETMSLQGEISALQTFYLMGKEVGIAECTGPDTENTCCNNACTKACEGVEGYKVSGRTVDDCFRNCRSGCGYVMNEYYTVG